MTERLHSLTSQVLHYLKLKFNLPPIFFFFLNDVIVFIYLFFFVLAMLCSMRDLGSSTRD